MRILFCAVLTAFSFFLAGCNSSKDGSPAVQIADEKREAPTPEVELPLATNPEYLNWSRFKVGTEVRRKEVTSSSETTVTSIKSQKLVELTDEQIVIEWQVTTERSDGFKAVNPANRTVVQKHFRVPKGMKIEDFAKPSLNAKEAAPEKLTALGKVYDTRVYDWKNSTEGGEMLVRAWQSDEIPGRIVRQEMNVAALKRTTTDEVIAVNLPKE